MPRILIRTVGTAKLQLLDLEEDLTVLKAKQAIAAAAGLPLDRLKLIVKGKTLGEDHKAAGLKEGDTLTALVVPRPPPKHISSRDGTLEDEDEDLRFKISPDASPLHHWLGCFLRDKLQVPDLVLVAFFAFRLRTWALLLLMCILSPVAAHYDLGPIYVLGTCFALILMNLGRRKPGEASAYSVFNEGFEELPGTLNAGQLDEQIRAGRF